MRKLAVLGHPVAHSRSPAMHTAALEEMGLAGEWTYGAIEVAPEDFEATVLRMAAEGFTGANVTVPHKLAALAVATEASGEARAIGAANTLTFSGAGIAAENTDGVGILRALGRPVEGLSALVLGAGGSARAAVWALGQAGASVGIWNRTEARSETLAGELGARVVGPGASGVLPTDEFDILINTTSVGLESANPADPFPGPGEGADPDRAIADLKSLRLDADAMKARQIVVDLVYGTVATPLAAAAIARGATVVDGLEVLVHQGAASLQLWTGIAPPVETMSKAARAE